MFDVKDKKTRLLSTISLQFCGSGMFIPDPKIATRGEKYFFFQRIIELFTQKIGEIV
jgi:hypothetical protein